MGNPTQLSFVIISNFTGFEAGDFEGSLGGRWSLTTAVLPGRSSPPQQLSTHSPCSSLPDRKCLDKANWNRTCWILGEWTRKLVVVRCVVTVGYVIFIYGETRWQSLLYCHGQSKWRIWAVLNPTETSHCEKWKNLDGSANYFSLFRFSRGVQEGCGSNHPPDNKWRSVWPVEDFLGVCTTFDLEGTTCVRLLLQAAADCNEVRKTFVETDEAIQHVTSTVVFFFR